MDRLDTIDYLKNGNAVQQNAFLVLTENSFLEILADFSPILTGTIPIEINIEGSDLDIICCFKSKTAFEEVLISAFSDFENFSLRTKVIRGEESVIANLSTGGFEIEVFGQKKPVKEQMAYRHMAIEAEILTKKGDSFRKEIIRLKQEGMKTEPAFAKLLGLEGDPYEALLDFKTTGF